MTRERERSHSFTEQKVRRHKSRGPHDTVWNIVAIYLSPLFKRSEFFNVPDKTAAHVEKLPVYRRFEYFARLLSNLFPEKGWKVAG